jgi:cobalt-zinc-cadmium efflux system outer membrane protein
MSENLPFRVRTCLTTLAMVWVASNSHAQFLSRPVPNALAPVVGKTKTNAEPGGVVQVRLLEPVAVQPGGGPAARAFVVADGSLTVDAVVGQVLARNQTLAQMTAAWQAAATKYPQLTSPDDPMFAGMVAPNSFGSRNVQPGYRVEVSQKLLWPAKKNLRGEMALAEAGAAGSDVEDMKLQLTEIARNAFYEYYLVQRALAVNDDALKLLDEVRRNAETRFRTGQIPQQDILQADVEIGKQRERGITLERMRRVAIARINTLMHKEPSEPLASPPARLSRGEALPPANHLIASALARRPDLRALESRIEADRAALALAIKEYWPDVELAAAYDTIMGNGPMRDLAPQVGIRMNLPVRTGKRNAAIAEAQAKIAQRSAELAAKIDQVKFQIQESYEQVLESERILALYEGKILPQADENVKSAQNAYVTGKTPFVSLIEAQRSLVALRDRNFEATADYFRRRATLDRLVGTTP